MTPERIGQIALEAILFELMTTPKPGLVDRHNNGSHCDMNSFTFMASAVAIAPYFTRFAYLGFNNYSKDLSNQLSTLRPTGILAEKAMLEATGNVNTHKGAIFSLGLTCCAAGRLAALQKDITPDNICNTVKSITAGLCQREFETCKNKIELTKGERVFLEHGLTGIRGEAESGFKTVTLVSLPILKKLIKIYLPKEYLLYHKISLSQQAVESLSLNDILSHVLMYIISSVIDTNIVSRFDIEASKYAQKEAQKFINQYSPDQIGWKKALGDFDTDFINRNISPGGCADLLAVTWFLYRLQLEGKS